jgi:hypothetical protein
MAMSANMTVICGHARSKIGGGKNKMGMGMGMGNSRNSQAGQQEGVDCGQQHQQHRQQQWQKRGTGYILVNNGYDLDRTNDLRYRIACMYVLYMCTATRNSKSNCT